MAQILVLSRDNETKEQISKHLKMHQLDVVTVSSADAVLTELSRDEIIYFAVIVDGEQPEIDTAQFIENIREISKLPVVMLTKKSDADMITLFENGVDVCVKKPLEMGVFSAQVMALIRMQERLQSEKIRREALPEIRGIRMDPVRRRVRVRGKEKKFTRKEFDLLYFLMTHPEKVYTKEDLYREVWHEDVVGGTATVVMHIKKIRNIIEEKPSRPRILKTDWGTGYYFAEFDED